MYAESRREELLNRFKEALKEPLYRRFFDEDELVEVYDYATDEDDAYLQSEALLTGARLFPENEELEKRRAEFYSTLNTDSLTDFLQDRECYSNNENGGQGEAHSVYWRIMKCQARQMSADELLKELDYIIHITKRLDEEELIQLVKLASEYRDTLRWLFNNADILIELSRNEELVLHELGVAASEDDAPEAVQYFERLTELDPFNPQYWCKKAIAYYKEDLMEDALSAVEYAQALSPESREVAVILTEILSQQEDDSKLPQNFAATVRIAFNMDEADQRMFNNMLRALKVENRIKEALALAQEYAVIHAEDMHIVYDALAFIISNSEPGMMTYAISKLVQGILGDGNRASISMVIGLFMEQALEKEDFEIVKALFDYLCTKSTVVSWQLHLYLTVLVREGDFDNFVKIVNKYGLENVEEKDRMYFRYIYYRYSPENDKMKSHYAKGLRSYLTSLEQYLKECEVDSEDYVFAQGLLKLSKDL
ncbi:MAG: hypothetical protein K2M79_02730 [Muribaculaceae bacterium]|nr:hypothetical protein [Muribaculaceae bacterium]